MGRRHGAVAKRLSSVRRAAERRRASGQGSPREPSVISRKSGHSAKGSRDGHAESSVVSPPRSCSYAAKQRAIGSDHVSEGHDAPSAMWMVEPGATTTESSGRSTSSGDKPDEPDVHPTWAMRTTASWARGRRCATRGWGIAVVWISDRSESSRHRPMGSNGQVEKNAWRFCTLAVHSGGWNSSHAVSIVASALAR